MEIMAFFIGQDKLRVNFPCRHLFIYHRAIRNFDHTCDGIMNTAVDRHFIAGFEVVEVYGHTSIARNDDIALGIKLFIFGIAGAFCRVTVAV